MPEPIDNKAKFNLRPFVEAPLSKSGIKPIELESIDLSLFKEGPEHLKARQVLADKVEKSLSTYGFISIINHGIDQEELEHLKSVAQSLCELPVEEQKKYLAGAMKSDLEDRSVSLGAERGPGFKPKGYWSMKNGVEDSIVHYNFQNLQHSDFFDDSNNYPDIVRAFIQDIADYYRYLHNEVLRKLTILCDIVLELPEGHIWEKYYSVTDGDHENSGGGAGRFMLYEGMKPEDMKKVDNTWLRGHSDSGGFTFITSQPILSLQIRDYFTGEWSYVGHTPNSFIVNVADGMEFITGGYFKSSIHRVVSPPDDQKQYRRLVLIYFSTPKLSSIIDPDELNSPKLKRLGITKPEEWEKITFGQWYDEKARLFGKKKVNDTKTDEPKLVLVHGRLHERWHQAEENFNLEEARKRFDVITLNDFV
ncbi:uncharacterized protein SPAPADRAFT_65806 [Spathaspora passalidarum NRRL Y-27907]|uniref:Fe2OG dioxygenase domain-containing protein n=1 Tax=Spathaspora passalidarum (strain NRRL Y-27907 / 11-Y1) TaxID=619300 RepID=G3AM58_SPAPN|nr:uncharacterized protein SPAPADRAFT_65806 [Spathaspora passalidarum NRRL Y-27907]EGW32763.1 hypothetical protein SPAPADRAFT_65806 [Spathaspora passalidarum NRRL Y-27907]